MKIGIKNQFYPDAEQQALIEATFNNTRFIKNYFLAQRNTYWKNNKDLPKEYRAKPLSSLDEINQIKSLKLQKFSIDLEKANELFLNTKTNDKYIKNEYNTYLQKIEQKKLLGLKRHEKRLARAQRNLSRKLKGSKNREKARIKVAKIHNDLVNYRTDFYHKLSTNLVENNDKIVIEDLHIKGMVKNKRLSKSISLQCLVQQWKMRK